MEGTASSMSGNGGTDRQQQASWSRSSRGHGNSKESSTNRGLTLEAISGRLLELEELVQSQAAKDKAGGGETVSMEL